ncbi:hypothetical protein ACFYXM_08820 [Streptomyces sp. NPDC002476]
MIYIFLMTGLAGCGFAFYAKASDIRFLGGLAAGVFLLVALLDWGAW